jgi:UDP-N-acetylmuramate dehydrogenase
MELTRDFDLSKFSTLRIVAKAEKFARPKSMEEIQDLFDLILKDKLVWNILGAGSNSLLSSRDIPGVTLCTVDLDFIKRLGDEVYEVGAGLKMPRFCALMSKESLSGTEFMEGIPGTLGGGIVMNAGAHGSEIADILLSAKILNLRNLQTEEWTKEDLGFTYRRSKINPHEHLVLSGIFKLLPDDKKLIRERVVNNNKARTSHQPIKEWTCGCTFKNPEGLSAGKLIEDLGLKGMREGDFVISNLHGNFFENHGEGTSMDFCKLMAKVQRIAYEKSKIILYPEVKPMGIFTPEEMQLWAPNPMMLHPG